MKISASIYARDHDRESEALEATVRELDAHRVDYLHVDCRDNMAVFDDIRRIKKVSSTPIDLHLITPDPAPYFDPIRELGVELISIQSEPLTAPLSVPADLAARTGWACTTETPVEAFAAYRDQLSFALFMATTPGQSGGHFDRSNFERIRRFRRLFPGVPVHVDGGVDEAVSFILRNLGVRAAVSGSYLLPRGASELPLGSRLLALHRGEESRGFADSTETDFRVADFMLRGDELPVLPWPSAEGRPDFATLLQAIEDYAMGFVLLQQPDGRLAGLISNADVRRGLLRVLPDWQSLRVVDLLNPTPFTVRDDLRVGELLEAVKACPFPVAYLPVLDTDQCLVGALQFNNLIKGEA